MLTFFLTIVRIWITKLNNYFFLFHLFVFIKIEKTYRFTDRGHNKIIAIFTSTAGNNVCIKGICREFSHKKSRFPT